MTTVKSKHVNPLLGALIKHCTFVVYNPITLLANENKNPKNKDVCF
jgi:hypothetical protein